MENLVELVKMVADERQIEEELVFQYLRAALEAAIKKQYGENRNVVLNIDTESGEIESYFELTVVKEVEDDKTEIALVDAKEIDKTYKVGDVVRKNLDFKQFSRISAKSATSSIYQAILNAERTSKYLQYVKKEKEIINGVVQRRYRDNVYVNIGRVEGVLKKAYQLPNEDYSNGKRIKCYIQEVKETNMEPEIVLSRTSPELVKRLFELEVPEILEGDLIIKSIAREAGSRTKIAVYAEDEKLDALGACVGPGGSRVDAIVNELNGEKIDIIEYSSDPKEFIENALKPAKIVEVKMIDENSVIAVVPDYQLSLAIGQKGQNARLAVKLTDWKIDIKNKEEGISIDLTGKKNGRGAYICRSIDCFELAVKKNALPRALGSQVDEKVSKMIRDEILEGK